MFNNEIKKNFQVRRPDKKKIICNYFNYTLATGYTTADQPSYPQW